MMAHKSEDIFYFWSVESCSTPDVLLKFLSVCSKLDTEFHIKARQKLCVGANEKCTNKPSNVSSFHPKIDYV